MGGGLLGVSEMRFGSGVCGFLVVVGRLGFGGKELKVESLLGGGSALLSPPPWWPSPPW